ncbi:MAG: hypothetical protein HC905_04695 [Bacteroidales bacterium]|nr:hypothetical protein [Bacteroidales bacterium]
MKRRKYLPLSINATATHDTKRGEDSRARLNILTEKASDWIGLTNPWLTLNYPLKVQLGDVTVPDPIEEYFIYQSLAGAIPMDTITDNTFLERIEVYLQKALREAKIHTNWNQPTVDYENAVLEFTRRILNSEHPFKSQFFNFVNSITDAGITNSLSQLVLKCTCPGIPDFYQGTELWDLSLVDPDNRRQINYEERYRLLKEIIQLAKEKPSAFFGELLNNKRDGRIKLWMTHQLMQERAAHPHVFNEGEYLPLEVKGLLSDHILAFARVRENNWYLTIIPLYTSLLERTPIKISSTGIIH